MHHIAAEKVRRAVTVVISGYNACYEFTTANLATSRVD